MEPALVKKKFKILGMTCINCQEKIERRLRATTGVKSFRTSFGTGKTEVEYDKDRVSFKKIENIIEDLGYEAQVTKEGDGFAGTRAAGLLLIIFSLYFLIENLGILNILAPNQLAGQNMGYGMIFVIGLLTSVHCLAMCGGINLSQCIPRNMEGDRGSLLSTMRPAALYNLGRVISYTAVGFLVGGLGSVIMFSSGMQGILKLLVGIFMVIMGLNMLNIFTWLRRFTPRTPKFLAGRVNAGKRNSNNPLYIGLLNGFMPCGPLQAMQIYALSTGSPVSGAISMFLFSLGTVPLMFALGAGSSLLGRKFTRKVMTAGAVLVVVLGMSMLAQGMSLSGILPADSRAIGDTSGLPPRIEEIEIVDGIQLVRSKLTSRTYPEITVKAGIPVRWIIDAPDGTINGCNYRFHIPEYGIEHEFVPGENLIEFTPTKTGTFAYGCWMGMIRSRINVVEGEIDDFEAIVGDSCEYPDDEIQECH